MSEIIKIEPHKCQDTDITQGTDVIHSKEYTKAFLKGYVVARLASSPHSKKVPGSTPGSSLSVGSLHVLPVYAWVLSGFSGFLPPSKNMHVRLTGVSKLSLGVSVRVSVSVCVAL